MKLETILLLSFSILPFLAIFLPWSEQLNRSWLNLGALIAIGRIIMVGVLGNFVVGGAERIALDGSLVSGYPLDVVLSLDAKRFGFLLVVEFCFLLAHWMSTVINRASLIRRLICLIQGICALFVLSDNAVAAGGFLILGGISLYYLVRFSSNELSSEPHKKIASRIYIISFLLGISFISWGILEFSSKDMLFTAGGSNIWGSRLWILMLILSVPVSPFGAWLKRAMNCVPEGVALCIVIFFSALLLKHSLILGVVYPQLNQWERTIINGIGMIGAILSLGHVFLSKSRRDMLSSLACFFLSLVLVSLGVAKNASVEAAYFICVFLPPLSALLFYASSIQIHSTLQKGYMAILCLLVLGLPGTPIYLIFSNIGARTLDLGVVHILMFGILWFLYFCSSVYIGRKLFLDEEQLALGNVSDLESASTPIAAFGVVFMFFLILASQLSWRIL